MIVFMAKCAQQSVYLTGGSLRVFRQFFAPGIFPYNESGPRPPTSK